MLAFSLSITVLLSLTMIGFGHIFIKRPPKNINALYGYRTRMSCLNEDTWKFAHRYSGQVWSKSGMIMTILSLPIIIGLRKTERYEDYMLILFYFQMAVLLAVIPITERALRRIFDKNGIRLHEEREN